MARLALPALLLATLLALPTTSHAAVTCNIDNLTFPSYYGADACSAIPATITVTGQSTVLASSPDFPDVQVVLTQNNHNWSGSSSAAVALCNQIMTACGGTVGVAEQNGASVPTGGAFGGPGVLTLSW
ncbi:hypothetical protein MMC19_002883 [Ptychographa xylographoides]|nr:hypothetical protein [Ptychographa xylographoides]